MSKGSFRNSPLFSFASRMKRKIDRLRGRRHPIQDTPTSRTHRLRRLGTDYGGWTFVDEEGLEGSTILSAGLGEDASFDVEFAAHYAARVVIVDPTPRAVAHFKGILGRVGQEREKEYSSTGREDVDAYELRSVTESQLILIDRALWNQNGSIKFFQPKNPAHVSHSIVNFQHNYSTDTSFIEVQATTVRTLLNDLSISPDDVNIVKLDIEGAEIEVLHAMLDDGFFPRQLLVEFDELSVPNRRAYERVTRVDSRLKESGYSLIRSDGHTEFLYFKDS